MSTERKTLEQRAQMTDIERLRHSCAHIMATAILRIWPDAQFAYGPPIENGFYYDFQMKHRVTPDDFEKIEAEMKKISKENQKFEWKGISREDAKAMAESGRLGGLSERPGNPSVFKLDLIDKIPEGEQISCFQNGDFIDLCAGPHVGYSGKCKNVKLTSVSSSFYMGDETKPQLQRLYGTAFESKEELEAYFVRLEEAKKRDHRRLGKELKLFHIDEDVGQGLILWTPNGATLRQELQDFISQELRKQGYSQVFTPHIGKLALYKTSGHFPYYKDAQFPAIMEPNQLEQIATEGCGCAEMTARIDACSAQFAAQMNERTGRQMIGPDRIMDAEKLLDGFLLKPMNCPHHIKIFGSQPRSYRDLPVRLAEFGTVYRWEQSGELNGLTRVRGFTQDDAHLFCTEDQVAAEVLGCLSLVKIVLNTLGMSDYRVRVGLRDPDSGKYTGSPEQWDRAEAACREAAATLGVPFSEEPGEAAFYGPKIDFVIKDVIGREWQLGTVQVDYQLPIRFDLSYTGADNKQHRPVMIHRAPFGSMERFTGVLIEHFAGHFPTWLAPEQIRILTISEKADEFANDVFGQLKAAGLRVTLNNDADKIGAKIRLAQLDKVPYMLVIGEKEAAAGAVAVRHSKKGDLGVQPVAEFITAVTDEVKERRL
ncbi:threonine--tRNA ligase [Brevifollis gellanilyticus]|uniref:Threonine--tRNA ligase n=1 Tax=Brevifollis gellanilyticus TaxID=748831 RepID=A0A512M876_9BACT|nr:threonine--tRNA ligase [Brevifollis gellanilyticus]GEP42946.1 threonine--tRNA ligase [Brevifollis gellanilyticus]